MENNNLPKAKIDAIIPNENYEDLSTRIPAEKRFDTSAADNNDLLIPEGCTLKINLPISAEIKYDTAFKKVPEGSPHNPHRCLKIEPAPKEALEEGFITEKEFVRREIKREIKKLVSE
jgi:hypothetical protein